jgi:hypothetical protein
LNAFSACLSDLRALSTFFWMCDVFSLALMKAGRFFWMAFSFSRMSESTWSHFLKSVSAGT